MTRTVRNACFVLFVTTVAFAAPTGLRAAPIDDDPSCSIVMCLDCNGTTTCTCRKLDFHEIGSHDEQCENIRVLVNINNNTDYTHSGGSDDNYSCSGDYNITCVYFNMIVN